MSVAGPAVVVDDRRPAPDSAHDPEGLADDLARLLSAVLSAEGVAAVAEAGLHLVDREEIAALNAEHLGGDGATDVLSFPVDGAAADPADPTAPPSAGDGADRGVGAAAWLVGDVVLCPSVAAEQCAEHAGTMLDECRLLVVHGALHLCGWDHDTDGARRAMWARERDLMDRLGVAPPGDPWGAG